MGIGEPGIAGIARGFDIRLAAEGVERDDQMSALKILGCDEMQGFLFSRPVNGAEGTRILEEFRLPDMPPGNGRDRLARPGPSTTVTLQR